MVLFNGPGAPALLLGLAVVASAGCTRVLPPPTQRTLDSLYTITEGEMRFNARASIVLIECPGGGHWPVTPAHVAQTIRHRFPIRAINEALDLAVLAHPVEWTGPAVPLVTIMPVRGTLVWVIHAPMGVSNTISLGVVSWISETELLVSMAVFPGSSGGAVLDGNGGLVGLVVGMRHPHALYGLYQGLGFAVPAPAIRALLTTVDPGCADTT